MHFNQPTHLQDCVVSQHQQQVACRGETPSRVPWGILLGLLEEADSVIATIMVGDQDLSLYIFSESITIAIIVKFLAAIHAAACFSRAPSLSPAPQ